MNTAIVLLTAALKAATPLPAPEHRVVVCMTQHDELLPGVFQARHLASRMFAEIGVALDWQRHARTCPAGSIIVRLSGRLSPHLPAGALGYAELHSGEEIRVLYERIVSSGGYSRSSSVLAHVMVHEIAHVIQDVNRHSISGVMKAAWGSEDFANMPYEPLRFAREDVELIYRGLERRRLESPAPQRSLLASGSPKVEQK